jgi:hypothetical protein
MHDFKKISDYLTVTSIPKFTITKAQFVTIKSNIGWNVVPLILKKMERNYGNLTYLFNLGNVTIK